MRASGFSLAQIGAYFDVSDSTIIRRLHEDRRTARYTWSHERDSG